MIFPESLTLPVVAGAALVDSINPCVFGVLIFLIAFMTKMFRSPQRMLLAGLLYTAVVYVSYFLLGLGFLKITVAFGVSQAVYWVAALVAIAAGILEIKDFFWYGKGFSLKILPGAEQRIKWYTRRISRLYKKKAHYAYLSAGLLGFFVVLVELPCTGAPYLAILALLGEGLYGEAVPLFLLHNLVFIVPLLVIIGLAYWGASSTVLEIWRKKYRGGMRLAVGIFLLLLGAYMIYSIT